MKAFDVITTDSIDVKPTVHSFETVQEADQFAKERKENFVTVTHKTLGLLGVFRWDEKNLSGTPEKG